MRRTTTTTTTRRRRRRGERWNTYIWTYYTIVFSTFMFRWRITKATELEFVPLRKAAENISNFTMGAAGPVSLLYNESNVTYQNTLIQNYGLTTAENACKWASTEPQEGTFAFSGCTAVQKFCENNKLKFRGHNLCWGKYNPAWLTSLNASEKKLALQYHIKSIVTHYNDSAVAWDVVNEAIGDSIFVSSDVDRDLAKTDVKLRNAIANGEELLKEDYRDSNPWGFKTSDWYPDVPNFVWIAFSAARAAAPPGVKLFYNDYAIADANSDKAKRVYALVKNLTAMGLIDGVGLQMHVQAGWETEHGDGLSSTLHMYEKLGLEVHITEMDVTNEPRDDNAQAKTYVDSLSRCVASSICTNFETWGFTDAHTWKGTEENPLPFNTSLLPKTAAKEMSAFLQNYSKGLNVN